MIHNETLITSLNPILGFYDPLQTRQSLVCIPAPSLWVKFHPKTAFQVGNPWSLIQTRPWTFNPARQGTGTLGPLLGQKHKPQGAPFLIASLHCSTVPKPGHLTAKFPL